VELSPAEVAVVQEIDGVRSIGQMSPGALALVKWLWQLDILSVAVDRRR